jgi:hypothetical protein
MSSDQKDCVLVLAFHDYSEQKYDQWFPDFRFIYMVHTDNVESFRPSPSETFLLSDYGDLDLLRNGVAHLAQKYHFVHVIARAERDVIRAAILREHYQVPGLTIDESLVFRNKYRMYCLASRQGIPLSPFCRVEDFNECRDFFRQHGRSVVKPSYGSGSLGVEIIRQESDLRRVFGNLGQEELILQKFSAGTMYHLDGVWTGERVAYSTVSRYINTCVSFREDSFLGSVIQLPGTYPSSIDQAAPSVLSALGVNKTFIFHLEIFVDGDEWTLCEIGCRPGGTRVIKTIECATGVNLDQLVLSEVLKTEGRLDPVPGARAAGWIVIPPRAGRVKKISFPQDQPWIHELRQSSRLYDQNAAAQKSGDYWLSYVVDEKTSREVENRLQSLGADISSSIVMCEGTTSQIHTD